MSATDVLFDAPGPKARARHRLYAAIGGLVFLAIAAWMILKFKEKGQFEPDKWTPFLTGEAWRDYLLPGLLSTLKAAAISIVLAGIFGLIFGLARLSHIKPIRWFATIVVEFFRSIPVLVMMIAAFAFFSSVMPDLIQADYYALAGVIAGLTFYNGAIIAELIRSGVGSLPKGQSEAGLSVGLTQSQTLRTILLPQAVTAMLPALVGQLVVVLKDTALGYTITYPELLTTYSQFNAWKSNPIPALIVIAAIYVVINYLMTMLASRIEKRLRNRGRGTIHKGGAGPGAVAQVNVPTPGGGPGTV